MGKGYKHEGQRRRCNPTRTCLNFIEVHCRLSTIPNDSPMEIYNKAIMVGSVEEL